MGSKTIAWVFQATNKRVLAQENVDMSKKEKPYEINLIFSNSGTKHCQKDKLYESKNWKDATK